MNGSSILNSLFPTRKGGFFTVDGSIRKLALLCYANLGRSDSIKELSAVMLHQCPVQLPTAIPNTSSSSMCSPGDKAAFARVLKQWCDDLPTSSGGARGGSHGAGRGGHHGGPGRQAHELLSKEHMTAIKTVVRDAIRTELSYHVGNGGVRLASVKQAVKRKPEEAQKNVDAKRAKPAPDDDSDGDGGPKLDSNNDPIYNDEKVTA